MMYMAAAGVRVGGARESRDKTAQAREKKAGADEERDELSCRAT